MAMIQVKLNSTARLNVFFVATDEERWTSVLTTPGLNQIGWGTERKRTAAG
jgi:hypothetical protein